MQPRSATRLVCRPSQAQSQKLSWRLGPSRHLQRQRATNRRTNFDTYQPRKGMTPNRTGKGPSKDFRSAEHVRLSSQMATAGPCVANKPRDASAACSSGSPQSHIGHTLGCQRQSYYWPLQVRLLLQRPGSFCYQWASRLAQSGPAHHCTCPC